MNVSQVGLNKIGFRGSYDNESGLAARVNPDTDADINRDDKEVCSPQAAEALKAHCCHNCTHCTCGKHAETEDGEPIGTDFAAPQPDPEAPMPDPDILPQDYALEEYK